jgi:hypothetical protein
VVRWSLDADDRFVVVEQVRVQFVHVEKDSISGVQRVSPELKAFVDRVIVPALLERFLREQAAANSPQEPPLRPAA